MLLPIHRPLHELSPPSLYCISPSSSLSPSPLCKSYDEYIHTCSQIIDLFHCHRVWGRRDSSPVVPVSSHKYYIETGYCYFPGPIGTSITTS